MNAVSEQQKKCMVEFSKSFDKSADCELKTLAATNRSCKINCRE